MSLDFDLPEPGRTMETFHVTRAVAWRVSGSDRQFFTTRNTFVYIYKGLAPTFNVYLMVYNASIPGPGQPDMIVINLQQASFDQNSGSNVLVIRDLSSGTCLRFANRVQAEDFEMSLHAILLEAAAEYDGIPFEAVARMLLDPAGVEYDSETGVFPALERLYQDVEDGLYD